MSDIEMELPYNKREIDMQFSGINEKLDTIDNKVTITNGTVADLKSKMIFFRGALWAIGTIMTLILIPISVYYINQRIQAPSRAEEIQAAVDKALANYNIEVQ